MNILCLAIACFVSYCVLIDAHSYPGCTKLIGAPASREGTCVGFIQGYPSTNIYGLGFEGMMTHQIGANPEQKLCKWTHDHYENVDPKWNNRASALPGETLWFRWSDFGHHPGGSYPGPSNFSLFWNHDHPNVDFNQLTAGEFMTRRGNKWLVNAARNNLLFPNPPTSEFLDPTCRDQRVPCIHSYTIPANTKPGVYSFLWWWDIEGHTRPDSSNVYTSCFDIEVRTTHPTRPGSPFAAGNRFQLTVNGQYLVNANGALTTSATGGDNSYFTTTVFGDGLVGISSTSTNQFWSVQPNGAVQVNRGNAGGSWEILFINQLADGSYVIKSIVHGLYLTAAGNTVSFTLPTALSDGNKFRVPGAVSAPAPTPAPAPAPTPAPAPEPTPAPAAQTPAPTSAANPAANPTPPESVRATGEGSVTLTFPRVAGATGYRVHVRPTVNGVRGALIEFHFNAAGICAATECYASLSTQRTTASFVYAVASASNGKVSSYTRYAQYN